MVRIAILSLFLFLGLESAAQNELLKVLPEVKGPVKHHFYQTLMDDHGSYASIPISVIKGKEAGPTLAIIAGIHGYEYPPIIAMQTLIQEIKPALLSGTLIILPMANPNAFYGREPFLNPQDGLNLNRVFPGDSLGTITERIADFMTNSIISESDVFIDIHGGDANEDLLPFVCYYNNESKPVQTSLAKRLSEASGFEYVVSYAYTLKDEEPAKYAFKQAVQDGKTGLSIEAGKLGNVQEDEVDLIKNGVYNMLNELDMYTIKEQAKPKIIRLDKQSYLRSAYKGVFYSDYKAGDRVEQGAEVGVIKNAFGEIITTIIAPVEGIILYKIGTPPVNKGETIMCIGF
ncbi:MAG: M14 family metallopeptidase [Bacteroidota bacterium]